MTKSTEISTSRNNSHPPSLGLHFRSAELVCETWACAPEQPGSTARTGGTIAMIRIPVSLPDNSGRRLLDRLDPERLENCGNILLDEPYLYVSSLECALAGTGRLWSDWRNDPMLQAMLHSLVSEVVRLATGSRSAGRDELTTF